MINLDELSVWIEEQRPVAEREKIARYDSYKTEGPEQRELYRLETIRELIVAGAEINEYANGYAYIQEGDRTFRFSLLKRKWSAAHNPTGDKINWKFRTRYRCKSPEDFVKRYVKGD
jgi:hypothetical protein